MTSDFLLKEYNESVNQLNSLYEEEIERVHRRNEELHVLYKEYFNKYFDLAHKLDDIVHYKERHIDRVDYKHLEIDELLGVIKEKFGVTE